MLPPEVIIFKHENKILNPYTYRWINMNGNVAKELSIHNQTIIEFVHDGAKLDKTQTLVIIPTKNKWVKISSPEYRNYILEIHNMTKIYQKLEKDNFMEKFQKSKTGENQQDSINLGKTEEKDKFEETNKSQDANKIPNPDKSEEKDKSQETDKERTNPDKSEEKIKSTTKAKIPKSGQSDPIEEIMQKINQRLKLPNPDRPYYDIT